MSDLQVSLIIIGIIIIIGVAVFNWVQQLRYRRKIESTLDRKQDDALFDQVNDHRSSEPHERIEPQLDKNFFLKESSQKSTLSGKTSDATEKGGVIGSRTETQDSATAEPQSINEKYDNRSNYIATISCDTVIPHTELNTLLQRKFDFNKPLV